MLSQKTSLLWEKGVLDWGTTQHSIKYNEDEIKQQSVHISQCGKMRNLLTHEKYHRLQSSLVVNRHIDLT